jgi:hypothetical protein
MSERDISENDRIDPDDNSVEGVTGRVNSTANATRSIVARLEAINQVFIDNPDLRPTPELVTAANALKDQTAFANNLARALVRVGSRGPRANQGDPA